MKRIIQLDMLRGLMLVIMTANHFGGPLKRFTSQPIGFISAAEGFIFLSGFVAGIVHGKRLDEYPTINRFTLKRSFIIYNYHVITLIFVFILIFFSKPHYNFWQLNFKEFISAPLISIINSFLFIYQPDYLNILPMYCIFFLFTPLILKQFRDNKYILVLCISMICWLIAQFDTGFVIFSKRGFFDILAWQILFVFGVFFGYLKYKKKITIPDFRAKPVIIFFLVILALILIAIRQFHIDIQFFNIKNAVKLSQLSWLRIINFTICSLLITLLVKKYPDFFSFKWFSFIGQHSLQVFSFHVVLVFLLKPLKPLIQGTGIHGEIGYIFFSLLVVASLSIPAIIHKNYNFQKNKTSNTL